MSGPGAMAYDPQPRRPAWGVRTPLRKSRSTEVPLVLAPPPARVWIALALHHLGGGHEVAEPLVAPGQIVACGEPVGEFRRVAPGLRIHASISGRVSAIEAMPVAGSHGPVPCVVIDGDGHDRRFDGYDGITATTPEAFRKAIADAGILGLGGAQFPTALKLATAGSAPVLLLNGAECEPYISCDDLLLRERADRVVAGARLLLDALQASQCVMAVKSDMPAARIALVNALAATGDRRIATSVVTAKYPSGGERQLIELVFGREVPAGGLPPDIGVVCQNVATAAAVADFFEHGRPLVSRIVTVTGGGIVRPCNIEARIGTPVADLVALAGGYEAGVERLVMGGPMMGIALPSDALPITAATNCVIAATAADFGPMPPEMPCIRCGDCVEACPARLLPLELLAASEAGSREGLLELGLTDCIECGACDYACPSHIRLASRFAADKALVDR